MGKEIISFPANVDSYNLKMALKLGLEVGDTLIFLVKEKAILKNIRQLEESICFYY